MKAKKEKEIATFELPDNLTMIGIFKLKDKVGRQTVRLTLKEVIKTVVIQKVEGESNKIIIAVEKGQPNNGIIVLGNK